MFISGLDDYIDYLLSSGTDTEPVKVGFVCFDDLCPSQQFFSHVGTEPLLFRGVNVSLLKDIRRRR